MKMKKTAALLAAAAILVSGCSRSPAGAEFSPDRSSVYVARSGAVTGASVEQVKEDYYDEAELKASVEEIVAALNEAAEGTAPGGEQEKTPAVVLKECFLKDGVAKMLIDFETPEEYVRYAGEYLDPDGTNRISWLDVTGAGDALAKGYLLDARLVKPSGDAKAVEAVEIAKQNLYVAAVKGAGVVWTEGKIQYVSDNVTVTGETTAQTPEDGTAYIIFK